VKDKSFIEKVLTVIAVEFAIILFIIFISLVTHP
jgi:Flp pilus assembly protein TadG